VFGATENNSENKNILGLTIKVVKTKIFSGLTIKALFS
jgi:hypothetical protein